ncbi:MAG: hypothetical protein P8X62_00060 [Flavobacteriaceae bacterium]
MLVRKNYILSKQDTNFKKTSVFLSFCFLLLPLFLAAQVKSSIDSTSIKIGEQITYKIQIETDTTSLVVFPEGQTFKPLEMIESYKIDTTKHDDKYQLIKKYGLTQFDSGVYTIPRQKIVIGDKTFFTDSLNVEVNNIEVDTTKQGLYDIKPIIEVEKSSSNWWKYLIIILLILSVVGFLIYWFLWRKKPLSEEEQIALLPPYQRAKLALKKLEESNYLKQSELKEYYSELTGIVRTYLDEKVYDHSLESTTDELIDRLKLLKEGNQIDLSNETIKNLEAILKRADLVKFAKSKPDIALAELDINTVSSEIDHVKEVLPEPTEEEKLLDQQYKEEQERKKKRKKIIISVAVVLFLMMLTVGAFSIKYGFRYVKDTIIGHESKELLEGDWVRSEYGFPPVTISTPVVLKRQEVPLPDELKDKIKMTVFGFEEKKNFTIAVATTQLPEGQNEPDINQAIEGNLQTLEKAGAQNIITKNEKFVTPNGAEGLKVFGTLSMPLSEGSNKLVEGEYTFLIFNAKNILQQISITWKRDDVYANQMVERILNSIELKPAQE